ncbi:MAG: ATP-binding protein [Xanthomonadales bacterium]|nr:ATP-binding protein [Xanthomonadales bacterium]
MINRRITSQLQDLLGQFPAVVLLGPRQVGKTTLALQLAENQPSIYLDLESDTDRIKLEEPELYLSSHQDKLVILDEVHRIPNLFSQLRGLIDKSRRGGKKHGQYLLLGSASLDLLQQSSESLAGRVAYIDLSTFNSLEVDNRNKLWVCGGFPDSFTASTDEMSFTWRKNFIRSYLERDIPQFGSRIPAETLRRFWTMLAHVQGGLLNAASLARGLDVDNKSIIRYLDLLVDLLLVRKLTPWHSNNGKRLTKSPKIYIRDSGLVHCLLNIPNLESLLSHPILGASWEAFVIENILQVCNPQVHASFYRSSGGAEIDLILEIQTSQNRQIWAIEIKRSLKPKVTRGFYSACEDISPHRKLLVYSGDDHFQIKHGIEVIGLNQLLQEVGKL